MDCRAYALGVLAALVLTSTASAVSLTNALVSDENGNIIGLDYESYPFVHQRVYAVENQTKEVFAYGSTELNFNALFIQIEGEQLTSNSPNLTLRCHGEQSSTTIFLWNTTDYVTDDTFWLYAATHTPPNLANISVVIPSDIPWYMWPSYMMVWELSGYGIQNESIETPIKWFTSCNITIIGSSAYINTYISPKTTLFDRPPPSDALADIVGKNSLSGTRGMITSGFIIFDTMLIISGIVLFFLSIVIVWKVFEYFVSRVFSKR